MSWVVLPIIVGVTPAVFVAIHMLFAVLTGSLDFWHLERVLFRRPKKTAYATGGTMSNGYTRETIITIPPDLDAVPELDWLIRSYRTFGLCQRDWADGVMRLSLSGATGMVWESAIQQAGCARKIDKRIEAARQHLARNECECGIYSTKEMREPRADFAVSAQCVIWGYVIPGSTGYRSEWCELESLALWGVDDDRLAEHYVQELAKNYGVPVTQHVPSVDDLFLRNEDAPFPANPYFASNPRLGIQGQIQGQCSDPTCACHQGTSQ